jgi:hypothetical protein
MLRVAQLQPRPLCPFDLPKPKLTAFLTSSRSVRLLNQIVTLRCWNHLPIIDTVQHGEFADPCAATRHLH